MLSDALLRLSFVLPRSAIPETADVHIDVACVAERPILFARTSTASQVAFVGADQLKAAWRLSVMAVGATVDEGTDCVFATGLVAQDDVRGPRYKPPERTLFEYRRSAATVIAGAASNARQQNCRAVLSFGLTSSCYRVEQPFIGS